jgi:hypothetical protein
MMVALAIYKDIEGIGYQKLNRSISFGFHINAKSLDHNVRAVRRISRVWSEQQLKLGRLRDWTSAASTTHQSEVLGIVHLWIDSSDFPLQRAQGSSTRDSDWSFKENSPAQRWMVLSDAQGRIRRAYGGYSPKLYDSHWLEFKKRTLERKLEGATVIADQHFHSGSTMFRKFKILTCHPIPVNRKGKFRGTGVAKLTKAQEIWNHEIKKIRGQVECPFGIAKERFQALKQRWSASTNQQSYLVLFAFAVHNILIQSANHSGKPGSAAPHDSND